MAFSLKPEADPVCIVVRRFCSEIWLASEKAGTRDKLAIPLGVLGVGISTYIRSNPEPSPSPSGPLGAFHLALRQANWNFQGPFALKSLEGEVVDLTKVPPVLVVRKFKRDYVQSNVSRDMCKLDSACSSEESRSICEVGLFLEPLKKLCRNAKTFHASGLINKFVTNGICTSQLYCQLGYAIDPVCARCGLALDTIYHRLYTCTSSEERARRNLGSKLFEEAIVAGPKSLLFTRALLPMPRVDKCPSVTHVRYINVTSDTIFDARDGEVYIDGSCSGPTWFTLARAGFAIVQINQQGDIVRAIYGSLPSRLPQNSIQAEGASLVVAFEMARRCKAVSDCQAVIDGFKKGSDAAATPSNPLGGVWRQISTQRGADAIVEIDKIKSHQAQPAQHSSGWLQWEGNFEADELAKAGAELSAVPQDQLQEFMSGKNKIYKIVHHMLETLSDWPKPGKLSRTRQSVRAANALVDAQRHEFAWVGDQWQCMKCGCRTKSPQIRSLSGLCKGNHFLTGLLNDPKGHNLFYCRQQGGTLLVYCSVCGSFAQSSPKLLKEACRGPPHRTEFGSVVLRRVRDGKHPVSGLPNISPPLKLNR